MGITHGQLQYAKRRALNIFDEWVDATGAIDKFSSVYYEIQGCLEDAVECGAQVALGIEEKLESEKGKTNE